MTTTPTTPAYDSATVAAAAEIGDALVADLASPRDLSDETRATCDSVAAAWAPVPGARLTRSGTILRPHDYLGDSALTPSGGGPRVIACVVEAYIAKDRDAVDHVRRPWRGSGWADLMRLTADGPDGGMTTHQRGRTRCEVSWQVPFGDGPEDTTTLAPFYMETATCWTHGRDVVPLDTAYLGG